MAKIPLKKPVLIILHGFPGSGKTHFANRLTQSINAVHVSSDKLRGELFEKPRFDKEENGVVTHLALYMCEEFLKAGVSVVFDGDTDRYAKRRFLTDIAKKQRVTSVLVWFQVDQETAFARVNQRDKRRQEDKFARSFTRPEFGKYISSMQNPRQEEKFVVLSGKHSFIMQKSTLVKRLFDVGVVDAEFVPSNVTKPGLVNLVPGRVDEARRNIKIR